MKKILIIILGLFLMNSNAWSQEQGLSSSPVKRTTATILFSSISGGILGLSTLSFYGKPQEHTDNITTGVLLGFLAGVGYVVYDNYKIQPQGSTTFTQNQEELRSLQTQKSMAPIFLTWNYSW